MIEPGKIYDISASLESAPEYPGDERFVREVVSMIGEAGYELSRLRMSAHAGTHLDAPAHFIEGGRRMEDYDASDFVLDALVIEVTEKEVIGTADLAGLEIAKGGAVLFKTANSRSGLSSGPEFSEGYVHLSGEAAHELAGRGVSLVGIDYVSIDGYGGEGHPAHLALLGAGVLVLEGIDLKDVPAGRYLLVCLPLKLEGEAAPARAILIARMPCR